MWHVGPLRLYGAYTPRRQIPMELESQARLANAALLTKWGYGNHCFGCLKFTTAPQDWQ